MSGRRLLILGGTGEALALAGQVATLPRLQAVSSLAGRTQNPVRPSGALRVGGFGGADGLADYLRAQQIDLLIDATHPFAAGISLSAARACEALAIPRLLLLRDPWVAVAGDRWIEVADSAAAAAALPRAAARVFLTVGRQELEPFGQVPGVHFLVRLVDPPATPLPLAACTIVIDRGPFAAEAEERLLVEHRIDAVVAKNSGGAATSGKIAAARRLGLPMVMLRRPAKPAGEQAATVAEAVAWLRARVG